MATTSEQVNAAALLAERGRMQEARALLTELAAAEPRHPDVLNGLGALSLIEGNAARAFEVLGAATTLHPRHAGLLANLAAAYRALGRDEEALAAIEQAIAAAPDNPLHHVVRAELLVAARQSDAALRAIERALQLAPDQGEIHLAVAVILAALGKHEGAELALRNALELDPNLKNAHHNLAEILATTGRHIEALRHAERAYLLDPIDRGFGLAYVKRLVSAGRLEEAERVVKRVSAVAPQDPDAIALRAQVEILRGDVRAGLARAAEPVRRKPKDAPTLVTFARALRLAGRLEEALVAIDSAIAIEALPALRGLRDDLLRALGRFEESWAPIAGLALPEQIETLIVPGGLDPGEAVLLARFRERVGPLAVLGAPEELRPIFAAAGWRLAEPGSSVEEAGVALINELPRATRITGADLPGPLPYLTVDAQALAPWHAALAEFPRPRIGVMWSTHAPGVTLELMKSAFESGVTPVSLAIGEQRHQLAAWPEAIDAGRRITGAGELMVAIAALDGVVAVDCLAAHIAGALGKPGVVLVGAHRPWPFFAREGRALFYPSLEVLAQAAPGRWTDEIEALRGRLRAWNDAHLARPCEISDAE